MRTSFCCSVEDSFGTKLRKSAHDSLRITVKVVQSIIIALVYMLPYLLIAGVLLLAFKWIRKNRRQAKLLKQPPSGLPVKTAFEGVGNTNSTNTTSIGAESSSTGAGDSDANAEERIYKH